MFDPEYLYQVTDEQQDDTNALDVILLLLLIRYMRQTLEAAAKDYETTKAAAAKKLYEESITEIKKYNNKINKINKKVFEESLKENLAEEVETLKAAGYEPKEIKSNPEVKQTIQSGYEKTNNTIRNYTKTTADLTQRDFIEKTDEAFLKMQKAGAKLDEVMFGTLKELATKGVFKVEYISQSGKKRTDHADVAARRALVTGLNQTYAEAIELYCEQAGHNLVQVSQHQGAREGEGINNHKGWQGKIYSLKDSTDKYPNLRRVTGYGQGAGLCGWNCRHSFGVYIKGQTDRLEKLKERPDVNYKGKTYTFYEATQEQRRMERNIRKHKREYYLARETNQPTAKINEKINYWTNEVDQFSKLIGNPRRKEAERVVSKF